MNDEAAWAAGTAGSKYAGDPTDPTTIPGSIVNPDYACVLDSTIAANTNAGWQAELAADQGPDGRRQLEHRWHRASVRRRLGELERCVHRNQRPRSPPSKVRAWRSLAVTRRTSTRARSGTFTTPALGKVVFGSKATVKGKTATLTVTDKSVEKAAGTITLSIKKGKKAHHGGVGQLLGRRRRDRLRQAQADEQGLIRAAGGKAAGHECDPDLDDRSADLDQEGHAEVVAAGLKPALDLRGGHGREAAPPSHLFGPRPHFAAGG